MGFMTGFVVIYNLRRRVIRKPRDIAEYYVRYGTFVPDFLASLPTIAEASPLYHPVQCVDVAEVCMYAAGNAVSIADSKQTQWVLHFAWSGRKHSRRQHRESEEMKAHI